MRDQYVGDVSDAIKFALLRRLAGEDRRLGIAWYYNPDHDGRPDGRHIDWLEQEGWRELDAELHAAIAALPERSISALERAPIWASSAIFHREPVPPASARLRWGEAKRQALADADLVFLDPDNGVGAISARHASFDELRHLRRPGRALVFITFPGRRPHADILADLHANVRHHTGTDSVLTLRTNISVPASKPGYFVQRQRWFTIIDADDTLVARALSFVSDAGSVRRLSIKIDAA